MTTREYFAAVRRDAQALADVIAYRNSLLARAASKTQRYDRIGGAGNDGTTAADRYVIELERAGERIRALDLNLIEADDRCAWVGAWFNSAAYAEVLYLYYVQAKPWAAVAQAVGYTTRHVQRLRDIACDAVDAHGWSRIREGRGMAEG